METSKKLSFFGRIKTAIFKLENYGTFIGEKLSVSVKYFFLLILVISIAISILDTYNFGKMINKAYNYIKNEMPDFSYENGLLKTNEITQAYDDEYKFYLYINTNDNIDNDTIKDYKTHIYDNGFGIILLNDEIIYIINSEQVEYNYQNLSNSFSLNINNKNDLIQKIDQIGLFSLGIAFFLINILVAYLSNLITVIADCILVATFGYIAARFCGVRMRWSAAITLSIYSLTLSVLLSVLYTVIYSITGFWIKYFNLMYLLIAYVYIVAAILMIKDDLIKQSMEVQKIVEVQKQVKEELESEERRKEQEKEEQEKENENKDKKNDDTQINSEPDGSEI